MVRRRPLEFLSERKSLHSLHVFLAGYEYGVLSMGAKNGVFGELRDFNAWVAKELGFSSATRGWYNMITSRTDSEEKAFDYFFELLDRYRSQQDRPASR